MRWGLFPGSCARCGVCRAAHFALYTLCFAQRNQLQLQVAKIGRPPKRNQPTNQPTTIPRPLPAVTDVVHKGDTQALAAAVADDPIASAAVAAAAASAATSAASNAVAGAAMSAMVAHPTGLAPEHEVPGGRGLGARQSSLRERASLGPPVRFSQSGGLQPRMSGSGVPVSTSSLPPTSNLSRAPSRPSSAGQRLAPATSMGAGMGSVGGASVGSAAEQVSGGVGGGKGGGATANAPSAAAAAAQINAAHQSSHLVAAMLLGRAGANAGAGGSPSRLSVNSGPLPTPGRDRFWSTGGEHPTNTAGSDYGGGGGGVYGSEIGSPLAKIGTPGGPSAGHSSRPASTASHGAPETAGGLLAFEGLGAALPPPKFPGSPKSVGNTSPGSAGKLAPLDLGPGQGGGLNKPWGQLPSLSSLRSPPQHSSSLNHLASEEGGGDGGGGGAEGGQAPASGPLPAPAPASPGLLPQLANKRAPPQRSNTFSSMSRSMRIQPIPERMAVDESGAAASTGSRRTGIEFDLAQTGAAAGGGLGAGAGPNMAQLLLDAGDRPSAPALGQLRSPSRRASGSGAQAWQ